MTPAEQRRYDAATEQAKAGDALRNACERLRELVEDAGMDDNAAVREARLAVAVWDVGAKK